MTNESQVRFSETSSRLPDEMPSLKRFGIYADNTNARRPTSVSGKAIYSLPSPVRTLKVIIYIWIERPSVAILVDDLGCQHLVLHIVPCTCGLLCALCSL